MKPSTPALKDGRHTRWDDHRRARRRDLLRATRVAVHDLGPEVSMEEIAAHAGTSKSVFYRYFGDKAGLQAAVSDEAITLLEERLMASLRESDDPGRALHAMVATYLTMADSSPHVYAFSVRPPRPDEVGAAGGEEATGDDVQGDGGRLHGFFGTVHGALRDRLHAELSRRGLREPGPGDPLALWPAAATGLVRSAGEAWLSRRADPDRAGAQEMAAAITAWLLAGPLSTASDERPDSAHDSA